MTYLIKPERNEVPLSGTLTPSLDEQLRAFAAANKVSRSQAVRYILSFFFDEDWKKFPKDRDKSGG